MKGSNFEEENLLLIYRKWEERGKQYSYSYVLLPLFHSKQERDRKINWKFNIYFDIFCYYFVADFSWRKNNRKRRLILYSQLISLTFAIFISIITH